MLTELLMFFIQVHQSPSRIVISTMLNWVREVVIITQIQAQHYLYLYPITPIPLTLPLR